MIYKTNRNKEMKKEKGILPKELNNMKRNMILLTKPYYKASRT